MPRAAAPARRAADRRSLALVFPFLSIERVRATRRHLFVGAERPPVAIVAAHGDARLTALDPAAARLGLAVGMTRDEAVARVPDLAVHPDDPHADLAWLERLAEMCGRYAMPVTPLPPDALVIDLVDAGAAFGGERALAADLEERLARQGLIVRHAGGDSPAIAEALARHAGGAAPDERGAVRRLPIAALSLDDDGTAVLAQAGMRTLGDVMALPRAAIAARFGLDAARAVRRLAGEGAGPPAPRGDAVAVRLDRHLDPPLVRAAALATPIAALVDEAAAGLAAQGLVGRRWRLRMWRVDGGVTTIAVDTPSHQEATAWRALRRRLHRLGGAAGDDAGHDLIRLDVTLAEPVGAGELRLDGGSGGTARAAPGREAARPRPQPRRSGGQEELPLMPAAPCRPPVGDATDDPPAQLIDPPHPVEPGGTGRRDGPPMPMARIA